MKKNKLYLAAVAALGLVSASCSDFLDRNDTNGNYDSNGFFSSDQALYDGAIGVYNMMYMNNVNGFYLVPSVVIFDHLTPMLLERTENTTIGAGGTLNPDNATIGMIWQNCYRGIARANEVIVGGEANRPSLSAKGKQYLAEVHALRAYFYSILTSLYGDVPFFMAPVSNEEYNTATRTPREKILDELILDLNTVAPDLPWMREEVGRVNRGFAYGIVNRLGLLGGSLNIGGKGTEYFKAAAEAAKKVIDEGGYQLAQNYGDLFNVTGQLKADVRGEIFYELPYANTGTASTSITNNIAFGQASRIQGQTGRHISQMIADTYECIDGRRIDDSPLYDNSHPQKNRDPRFAENIWMDGDISEINNGTVTKQLISCYNDYTMQYKNGEWVEILNIDKAGASASWASFCNAGVGLMNGKYCHETAVNIQASTVDVLVMRYPELLLGYAEAKIELGEFNDATVIEAINKVRRRAGVPEIDANGCVPNETLDGLTVQEKLRQRVRRERKVELMMEGLHLIDMRRWKTGAIENEYPSYGCPLIQYQYQAGNTYTEDGEEKVSEGLAKTDIPNFKTSKDKNINDIPCYDAYKDKLKVRDKNRTWNPAFELFPIPTEERNRSKNITQNEGYPNG